MRTTVLVLLGTLTGVATLGAQAVPARRLTTPDARFNHQFSSITGLRELPDGRVMVSDGIEDVVLRVNLRTGRADTLGRVGQGPGEYKTPDALFALPNHGTLLVDLGNGRLDLLDSAGRYRESTPIAQGNPPRLTLVIPRRVDGQGRIYFQPAIGGPRGEVPDSASVVRWDRVRARYDTVARVKLPEMNTRTSGTANNQSISQRPRPYPVQDTWDAGADGRVAVARGGVREYRVDWVMRDGRMVQGRPVAVTPVAVRQGEKEEWVEAQANGLRVSMTNQNGQVSMSFSRGGRNDAEEDAIAQAEWPATKPAFSGIWVTPEGEAWVERSVPAGQARQVDVFTSQGTLKEQIVLPQGRRIVGFGRGVVYLRQTDGDGLQYLERYRR